MPLLCLSWCKQALIHHQSPWISDKLQESEKNSCVLLTPSPVLRESRPQLAVNQSCCIYYLEPVKQCIHSLSVSLFLFFGWYRSTVCLCVIVCFLHCFSVESHTCRHTKWHNYFVNTFFIAFIIFAGTCLGFFGAICSPTSCTQPERCY